MIDYAIRALQDARLDIENWAGFASLEIQEQYGLADHLARIDKEIAELKSFLETPFTIMYDPPASPYEVVDIYDLPRQQV